MMKKHFWFRVVGVIDIRLPYLLIKLRGMAHGYRYCGSEVREQEGRRSLSAKG
jgi:hypothetical protein